MVWIKGKILDKGRIVEEQLLRVLQRHEDALIGEGTDIGSLEESVGALETTVGDSSSGLVKKTDDLETAVGDSSGGLVKKTNDLETAIGDESTEGTILARIKALEDAETSTNTPSEPSG